LTLKDSNGDDIDSDPVLAGVQPTTTLTDSLGNYSFGDLAPGSYQVVQTHPSIFVSLGDADGGDLDVVGDQTPIVVVGGENSGGNNFLEGGFGSISGTVLADINGDDLGDSALENVVLTLKNSSGDDIDSDVNLAGIQPTTTTTDSSGNYTFSLVSPGDYQVVQTQPAAASSVGDVDGANNNTIGDENLISVEIGLTNSGNDFVERSKPDTFIEFQTLFASELGGESAAGDNPDGDIYSNALEYALCLDPDSGLASPWDFCLVKEADGSIRVEHLRREGGLSDVTQQWELQKVRSR